MAQSQGLFGRLFSFLRPQIYTPPDLVAQQAPIMDGELQPSDFESRRESYPLYPFTGWNAQRIMQMLEAHDAGNFQLSEQFFHALNKQGLIGSALEMLGETACDFGFSLQTPKDAPDEMHLFSESLARDWQAVMPDEVRAEIVVRVAIFGFQICRVQWTWRDGKEQPRLIPYTHSNLSYRQDLWCYQALSERGREYPSSDGREWIVFSKGGTRPWLKGMIRRLALIYFGLITGDDRWVNFNDEFAQPLKNRIIPRIMRESTEAQRAYQKERLMRGGDMIVSPQDPESGRGYDLKYVQVSAQGFETIQKQLERFDEQAAIVILGHNLLQMVKSGSLAAMREAMKLLRRRAGAYLKYIQTGCEPLSKVWARANFGTNPADWYDSLHGQTPDAVSWSLVYDFTDPDERMQAGVRAAQFGQGFAAFVKSLEKAPPEVVSKVWDSLDILEAAERAGIPLLTGEDSYDQDDTQTELAADEWISPPAHMKAAARRALAWVHEFRRGGTEVGRSMARKIVRGRLSRQDVLRIARYWPRHEGDKKGANWNNLKKPSNGRIAWGLWGDSGDGRGRKWSESEAERIRGKMTTEEARIVGAQLALLDGELPLDAFAAPPALAPAQRLGVLGPSKRTRDLTAIASVACFGADGRLLMGRRRDSGKWTLPGGHLELGEAPHAGAIRELWEEAQISAPLQYLGSGQAGDYLVHAYRCDGVSATASPALDPDQEVSTWEWVPVPLPAEIAGALHAPRNVTLALLDLGPREGLRLLPAAG